MSAILRAPFPAFGSKRHAAALIWQALGDVGSYCEPFCFSAATRTKLSNADTMAALASLMRDGWVRPVRGVYVLRS